MGEDALIAAVLAEDSERRVCGPDIPWKKIVWKTTGCFQGNHSIASMYGIFFVFSTCTIHLLSQIKCIGIDIPYMEHLGFVLLYKYKLYEFLISRRGSERYVGQFRSA